MRSIWGWCDMPRITSIQIEWFDSGLHSEEDISHEKVIAYRNKGVVKSCLYRVMEEDTREYRLEASSCLRLFELMEQADAQGVFDNNYREFVCDGWAWKWQVRYSDNRIKATWGTVSFPPFGAEVQSMLQASAKAAKIVPLPKVFGC